MCLTRKIQVVIIQLVVAVGLTSISPPAIFANFIHHPGCSGNSGFQNWVRQPSRHYQFYKGAQSFGKEPFRTDVFRNRKLDHLEILILKNPKNLWASEILGGKQVLWECLLNLSENISASWAVFLEMAHIKHVTESDPI